MKGQRKKLMKKYWVLYIMILLPMISTFIFHYIPIYGILMAFEDYKPSLGILGSDWRGFKHFINFLNHPYFWRMIRNTLILSLCGFITFPLPIMLSIMFNEMRSKKLKTISQTVTFAPHFISTAVVCSMALLFMQQDGGLINIIIRFFGGEAEEWISYPDKFPLIYTIIGLWQSLGWGTILFTSSLASVPMDTVEAARIDGAGRFAVIWYVYLPHLKPVIIIQLILKLGSVLGSDFEKIFLLQNPLNQSVSSVLSTYSYSIGIIGGQYSYAAAIGLFNNIVSVILVVLANTAVKKLSDDQLGLW